MPTAAHIYAMLNNASLWQAAERCDELLSGAGVPYLVVGGVAVCLHGYQRNTVDLDLLIRREDQAAIRELLSAGGFVWDDRAREFRSLAGIPVQFLISGERAGRDSPVQLPAPDDIDIQTSIENLPVVTLAKLIELKLACGAGSVRRMHKDFADVVELIVVHQLDGTFARCLDKSVRKPFRELVKRARGSA